MKSKFRKDLGLYYSGTSGIVLPYNKTHFPPDFKDKSRLEYYATLFNSVEINSTFYKLPKPETVRKWAESVPANFKFTFKVPKSITHVPELNFELKEVADFINVISTVGGKNGCLLAQFPATITIEHREPLKKLVQIFEQNLKSSGWALAIEFRHTSWHTAKVDELLQSFNASRVLHDMKHAATSWHHVAQDVIYLRFHGPESRYRGDYSDEFLRERAESIKQWLREGKTVYAYFNNTMGAAFNNLDILNKHVADLP